MPHVILLPDDTGTVDAGWVVVPGGTEHEALDADDGDGSYVKCSTHEADMIIEYANPTFSAGEVASIDGCRIIAAGRSSSRRNSSDSLIGFHVPNGFDETFDFDAHASSYEVITGTVRETKPDSSAWAYSDILALELNVRKVATVELFLTYLAIRVDYTLVADNATFFGANF